MTTAVAQPEQRVLSPDELAAASPAYWAHLHAIQLQAARFSFDNGRTYMIEMMDSMHRREVCMKAAQMGGTEGEVLTVIHGLIHGVFPRGVLYLFPTTDEVNEFSKARFKTLIDSNKEFIGRYVKVGGKGTDSTSLKRIGNSLLYLRGARLTQSVGAGIEEKESVKLRSIPVDRCVFDESDLMDDDVFAKARGRMGDSDVKQERYYSNPTLPGVGIDKLFNEGDQRHWFRRCECGEWVCAELTFPECVHIGKDGRGFIACKKCGRNAGATAWRTCPGQWVPAKRENSDYMHSRRLSQLMSATNDPAEILKEYNDPPQGNKGDVLRLRLGLPYVAAEDKLTTSTIMECSNNEPQHDRHSGPCAMGVDIGKVKHVVIGCRTGSERWEIVRVARVTSWNDLHDMAHRFNVRSAVIDARPYEDEARAFQKAERYRVFLCEYAENSIQDVDFNDLSGIVKVNRTQIFDRSHRLFSQRQLTIPRACEEINEFAAQCCNTAKVLETNRRSGTGIYRYRPLGDEHYRNALNYFILAAHGTQIAKTTRTPRIATRALMSAGVGR